MSNEFVDIKMTGLDEKGSRPVGDGTLLFRMQINLSAVPPSAWAQYFNDRWKQHFYMRKRRADVSGATLTIECVPDELEKDHIPELKKVIAETNETYRQYHARKQQQLQAEAAQKAADNAKLADLKKSIKFD